MATPKRKPLFKWFLFVEGISGIYHSISEVYHTYITVYHCILEVYHCISEVYQRISEVMSQHIGGYTTAYRRLYHSISEVYHSISQYIGGISQYIRGTPRHIGGTPRHIRGISRYIRGIYIMVYHSLDLFKANLVYDIDNNFPTFFFSTLSICWNVKKFPKRFYRSSVTNCPFNLPKYVLPETNILWSFFLSSQYSSRDIKVYEYYLKNINYFLY